MKPPICEVCGDRFGPDEGALLEFEKTPSDMAWYQRQSAEDFVGHPPNVAWFCGEHAEAAGERTHLSLGEALDEIR